MIKTKSLSILGAMLLALVVLTGCREDFVWSTKVDKKSVFIGEVITVTLHLKNNTDKRIKSFDLVKCRDQRKFIAVGEKHLRNVPVDKSQKKTIRFQVFPISTGQLELPCSLVTKITLNNGKEHWENDFAGTLKSFIKIKVAPLDIAVSLLPGKGKDRLTVGKNYCFDILVENRSPIHIEAMEFGYSNEKSLKSLVTLQKKGHSEIKANHQRLFPMSLKTLRPGTAELGSISVKKIKLRGHWVTLDWKCKSNPGPEITITAPKISIHQYVDKKSVNLGEKLDLEVVVINHSSVNIKDISFTFQPALEKLRFTGAKPNRKYLPIAPGKKTEVEYEFIAIESGPVHPFCTVVKEMQVGEYRFCSPDKPFSVSNPVSQVIEVRPVRLPGIKYPQTVLTPQIETYLDSFLPKVLAIPIGIILLFYLFRLAIRCEFSEYFAIKVALNFLMGGSAVVILVYFITGIRWAPFCITPSVLEIAALWSCSCFIAFAAGLIFTKNILLGSVLSGSVTSAASYSIFVGAKTFSLQAYSNFPESLTIFLVFVFGLGLNVWAFRKI